MDDFELFNPLTGTPLRLCRILGRYSQGRPGPLLLVLAGIHGNEPSGVLGAAAVLERLKQQERTFYGEVLAIAGNLPALAVSRRYLDEDLNRIWHPERIQVLREGKTSGNSEEREMLAVLDAIESHATAEQGRFFIDCHTTSSASLPYISVPQDLNSIRWAQQFPIITVIGAGDALKGTSDRFLIDRGFTGITFEAGRHHSLASIEAQEAAIWMALHQAGCIETFPTVSAEVFTCSLIHGLPTFSIEYIHRITPASDFRMRPGFCNFQPIREGELLAWEHGDEIHSRWDANIFLPLYQSSGDDGFSIIRQTSTPPED